MCYQHQVLSMEELVPWLIQDSSELFDAPSVGRWSLYSFLLWYELWDTSDGWRWGWKWSSDTLSMS